MNSAPDEQALVQRAVTITDPNGLHARPAVQLTLLAKKYQARVELRAGSDGEWVNAKSPNAVMKLRAVRGEIVSFRASGVDAEEAVVALSSLFQRDPVIVPLGEQVIRATAAAEGLVIGAIAFDDPPHAIVDIPDSATDEGEKLRAGISRSRDELCEVIAAGDDLAAEILEFQLALLEDEGFLRPVLRRVSAGASAVQGWTETLDREIAELARSDNEHRAARADDLRDLKSRVLRALSGGAARPHRYRDGAILIAEELTPSRFLEIDWRSVAGAALRGGSRTSHVSILARARGVPLLTGLERDLSEVLPDTPAVLDAYAGQLILAPSPATVASARQRLAANAETLAAAEACLPRDAVTADGQRVQILLNVDDPAVIDRIPPQHCDGIGLTRTEFLFRGPAPPDEESQLEVYRRIVEWADGRPVTFRTLDGGGDKPIPGITADHDKNPLLGVRGVRLSLAMPQLFEVQLRALARAAGYGTVKVLIPMVTAPWEMERVRHILGRVLADLAARGVAHGVPQLGMMVEVPAAALTAEAFEADFYAVGSNDLVQYTLACARDNPAVGELADPDSPAILELIRRTVWAAEQRGVDVSLCGSLASDPTIVPKLLDCGLRALSVEPAQLGRIKWTVGQYRARP
jgi:phosphotransferase system enzyme I (PtsI)